MAYSKAWDETQPDGSENANTIDTEIQDTKISVRERMNDILSNAWETDGDDPKLLKGSAFADEAITYAARANERAYLSLTSSQSIPNTTATAIDWDTEDVDEGNLVDLGTQPSRITIANTGFYIVVGNISWTAGTTGVRRSIIVLNGATDLAAQHADGSIDPAHTTNVSYLGALAAGNYIELEAYHSEGVAININAAMTFFSLVRLA